MKRSQFLAQQAAEKLKKAQALMAAFEGKTLPEEQYNSVEALLKEVDQLNAQAEQAKKAEQLEEKYKTPATSLPLKTKGDDPEEAPEGKGADPAQPKDEKGQKGPFKSLGEQLIAVKEYATKGAHAEEFANIKATGNNEIIDSEGGILIQPDFAEGIFHEAFKVGELISRVRKYPIIGNYMRIRTIDETSRKNGSRYGGVQMQWVGEGQQSIAGKLNFDAIDLKLNKLMGYWYVTDENLEDAPFLSAFGKDAFTDEAIFQLDDAIWEGDGKGKPLGMFNSPAMIQVDKKAGQAADTVVVENILSIFSRVLTRSKKRGIWVYNQEVFEQLAQLKIGDRPVMMPQGGLSGLPYATILGRPAIELEQASALGDAGDVAFIDPTLYAMVQKGGVEITPSIHVKFLEDETCFRIKVRADGAPLIKSAVTPFKGTKTLSGFVTVADRA
jgi:HK97 family phage major capsid protein